VIDPFAVPSLRINRPIDVATGNKISTAGARQRVGQTLCLRIVFRLKKTRSADWVVKYVLASRDSVSPECAARSGAICLGARHYVALTFNASGPKTGQTRREFAPDQSINTVSPARTRSPGLTHTCIASFQGTTTSTCEPIRIMPKIVPRLIEAPALT
jgi:hypothetical protein